MQALFQLRIITPMFLTGADGRTPELRGTSFKGMIRFWWRALHSHLSIEKMYEQESQLFGSSDENFGKSKLLLKLSGQLQTAEYQLVPRSDKPFKALAFKEGESFSLLLSTRAEELAEIFVNITKIAIILGGFGKRSRRGFGSLEIVKINDTDFNFDYSPESICNLLNKVAYDCFAVREKKIIRTKPSHNSAKYPYIKEIYIKETSSDASTLLSKIAESAHKNDCEQTGFTKKEKRFASPIYVTVKKLTQGYCLIITVLNTAYPEKFNTPDKSVLFIHDILNSGGKK